MGPPCVEVAGARSCGKSADSSASGCAWSFRGSMKDSLGFGLGVGDGIWGGGFLTQCALWAGGFRAFFGPINLLIRFVPRNRWSMYEGRNN